MDNPDWKHDSVEKLSQAYADLHLAELDILKIQDGEYKTRILALVREAKNAVEFVIDKKIGPQLVENKPVDFMR